MNWWTQLSTIAHADPHVRRRGRLLVTVLLVIIGLDLVCLPLSLRSPVPLLGAAIILITLAIFAAGIAITRAGHVSAAGWVLLATQTVAIALSTALGGPAIGLFFLAIPVITASLVLPPRQIWAVTAVALASAAAATLPRPDLLADPRSVEALAFVAPLIGAASFLAFLGARAMEQALAAAEASAAAAADAQAHAESQARDLAARTDALQRAEGMLHDLVATLETPTVALADGVLLAPLIGAIDSRRAEALTSRLLHDVADQRVRLLILDIAGVTLVDTAVAHALIRIAQAVRLLGCRITLTSVNATVALTLTHLGTDLGGIETAHSPQDVLASLVAA